MKPFAAMAFAMPQGCAEAGTTAPGIKLIVWKGGDSLTLNMSRAEGDELLNAVAGALGTFALAEAQAADGPRPYRGPFPDHAAPFVKPLPETQGD